MCNEHVYSTAVPISCNTDVIKGIEKVYSKSYFQLLPVYYVYQLPAIHDKKFQSN